jgi:protein TonB
MKELLGFASHAVFSKNHFTVNKLLLAGIMLLCFVFCLTATSSAATEYDASDVDSPPKIVRQMPVKYPAQAKKDGITGKVIVRCLIGVNGKADRFEIVESDPAGVFDDSAVSTLKYWQFRPGIKSGELVATWVKVPFKFE